MDRRDALRALFGGAAVVALGAHGEVAEGESDKKPERPAGFRIGACDWNLGKSGDPEAMRVAKEIGLDGVQVSFGAPGGRYDLRRKESRDAYAAAAKKHGTAVGSLAIGILNNVPYKSDSRTEQWVHDSILAARAMGTNVVLLAFFGKGDLKGDRAGADEVIRRLRRVAPVAEKNGVILGLETWLDKDEHLYIVDGVGSRAVQVYYDLGNSKHRGYDIYREIRELGGKQICEFHAKDYAGKLFGHGEVDFWEARRAMDDIGYRGWIHIEGRQPFGMMRSYQHDLRFLRAVFPRRVQG